MSDFHIFSHWWCDDWRPPTLHATLGIQEDPTDLDATTSNLIVPFFMRE
jgi:hypothetical protein